MKPRPARRYPRTWLLLAVAIILAGVAVRLHRHPAPLIIWRPPPVEHQAPLEPVIPVAVELARTGTLQASTTATGIVSPGADEVITAPYAGTMKAVKVKPGARVQADAVLAVLAQAVPSPTPVPSPVEPPVAEMNANAQETLQALSDAKADVSRAQASVAQAQANQETTAKTLAQDQNLLSNGAISRSDMDADQEAATKAQAKVAQAQDHLAQAREAVTRELAALDQERTAQKTALARPPPQILPMQALLLQASHGEVKATLPGLVSRVLVKPGQAVKAKAPLFKIGRLDTMRVVAHVSPTDAKALKPGTTITVSGPTLPFGLDGELSSVQADGKIVALVANPEQKLAPGAVVSVKVPLEAHTDVVTVPAAAVTQQDGRTVVWITHRRVDEVVAISIPVVAGVKDGDRQEIVEGIQVGDPVIWKGLEDLSPGVVVHQNSTDAGSTEEEPSMTPSIESSAEPSTEPSAIPSKDSRAPN
ncbi:MAG TPA: HlyD family efflux transporter periplasmic adaptor subunit [Candidatus Xenobia bacterium]